MKGDKLDIYPIILHTIVSTHFYIPLIIYHPEKSVHFSVNQNSTTNNFYGKLETLYAKIWKDLPQQYWYIVTKKNSIPQMQEHFIQIVHSKTACINQGYCITPYIESRPISVVM